MILRRIYSSPWLIPVLSVLTVAALAASAWAVFGVLEQDHQREQDRIAADVTACERGNILRGQVIAVGDANEELVQGIIDVVLPPDVVNGDRAERISEIRAALAPLFAQHRDAVDDISLTDCQNAVPGARTTTTRGG